MRKGSGQLDLREREMGREISKAPRANQPLQSAVSSPVGKGYQSAHGAIVSTQDALGHLVLGAQ